MLFWSQQCRLIAAGRGRASSRTFLRVASVLALQKAPACSSAVSPFRVSACRMGVVQKGDPNIYKHHIAPAPGTCDTALFAFDCSAHSSRKCQLPPIRPRANHVSPARAITRRRQSTQLTSAPGPRTHHSQNSAVYNGRVSFPNWHCQCTHTQSCSLYELLADLLLQLPNQRCDPSQDTLIVPI